MEIGHNRFMVKENEKVTINRHVVLAIAVVCLLAGAYLAFNSETNVEQNLWKGAFVRVGILMLAFWVALPTKKRPAAWSKLSPLSIGLGIAAVVLVGIRPKVAIMIVIPAFALLFVLSMFSQPEKKYRPPRHD